MTVTNLTTRPTCLSDYLLGSLGYGCDPEATR